MKASHSFFARIAHLEIQTAMQLHYGDLTDSSCLVAIISQVRTLTHIVMLAPTCFVLAACLHHKLCFSYDAQTRPDEIYNLGAMSHVKVLVHAWCIPWCIQSLLFPRRTHIPP